MGLQVNISAEEGENSLIVYECTGNYSASNPGGFGPLTYRKNQISESFIEIQGPSDTESYPHKIDVTGDLPNNDNTGFEIMPSQVGQGNEMESGLYKVKLTHILNKTTGGTESKTAYLSIVLIDNVACCIDKQSPKLKGDILTDPVSKKVAELQVLLSAAKMSIKNELYEDANKTIEYLKSQCKCNGCK